MPLYARDLMITNVVTISPTATLAEAADQLLDAGINGAPVVDADGQLIGMIGLKDILRAPAPAAHEARVTRYTPLLERARAVGETRVAAVMAQRVVTVRPDTPVEDVLARLVNRGRHPIPVVEAGRLVGVIGRSDVVRALLDMIDTDEPELAPA